MDLEWKMLLAPIQREKNKPCRSGANRQLNTSIQALVVGLKATGKNWIEIAEITWLSRGTCHRVYARALKRGFDSSKRPLELLDTYFGSLSTQTQEEPKDDTLLKKTKYILVVEEKKHVLTFPASTEKKTQNEKWEKESNSKDEG